MGPFMQPRRISSFAALVLATLSMNLPGCDHAEVEEPPEHVLREGEVGDDFCEAYEGELVAIHFGDEGYLSGSPGGLIDDFDLPTWWRVSCEEDDDITFHTTYDDGRTGWLQARGFEQPVTVVQGDANHIPCGVGFEWTATEVDEAKNQWELSIRVGPQRSTLYGRAIGFGMGGLAYTGAKGFEKISTLTIEKPE